MRRFILMASLVLAVLPFAAQAQAPTPLQAPPAPLLASVPPSTPVINLQARQTSGQLSIPVDKSQLLHVDQAFGELSVGNKDIADVVPLSRNLIYVLGKKRGATNITISDQGGNILAVVDVLVTFDADALKRSLADVLPEEKVSIQPAGDSLILSGTVSSADRLRQILAVAERYAPGGITNLLSLTGSQQVLLQVRFAEVQRSALADLGANFLLQYTNGNGAFALASGLGTPSTAFGALAGQLTDSLSYNLQSSINALEKKGLLRTLAEPNLIALSGDTASFLAGGQIPIPVAQTSGTTTIPVLTVQYKDFGVSLAFTPTVIGKEQINLEMSSEVSSIDPTLSVSTGGISVPGLKVRRAKTTIELKDGQSFSIAGLLQDDFQDGVSQLPVLGSIPILGTLFRSTNFQHQQTELVVLITTHLVDPSIARNIASPTDAVVLPSPVTLFGEGKPEQPVGGPNPNPSQGPSNGYVLP
jgi:pilus assembly protein CpaC